MSTEERLQKLFTTAMNSGNPKLISALGIITTKHVGDKRAVSIHIYRLKEIIANVRAKLGTYIDELEKEYITWLQPTELAPVTESYLTRRSYMTKELVKTASKFQGPVFRRVS